MDSVDVNSDTITYGASVRAVAASGDYAPFWFHSNRYGAVSAQPYSGQLSLSVSKELTRPRRWYDYSFGIEAAFNRVEDAKAVRDNPNFREILDTIYK